MPLKRTKEDWDKIITSWKNSGMSHTEYCRKQNLNYWTFRDQRLKREHSESSKRKLVRISPVKNDSERTSLSATVTLPSGISIQISSVANKNHLQELFEILWNLK